MSDWDNAVPPQRDYATIQLMRVPNSARLLGIAINTLLQGRTTHWDGRRTGPCPGTTCPMCRDGHIGRWHAYVPLFNQSSGKIFVVQLTALAAGALQEEAQRYKTLRGLLLQISRVKPRDNARILIEARALPVLPHDLPDPIDIPRFMASVWNSKPGFPDHNREPPPEPPK